MRKKIVAANWKMNTTLEEGVKLAIQVCDKIKIESETNKIGIICPPFTHLNHLSEIIKNFPHFHLGAQNCHWENNGAFTGELSASMLQSCSVEYVLAGHSERRQLFGEKDKDIARKVNSILACHMIPIFCCGETLEARNTNDYKQVVEKQLKQGLFHLVEGQLNQVVIAYEPVWAIGTGEVASPLQAQEMHAFIRKLVAENYSQKVADSVSILYGGSIKPENASLLFAQLDVDGGLVGGASLDAESFAKIFYSF